MSDDDITENKVDGDTNLRNSSPECEAHNSDDGEQNQSSNEDKKRKYSRSRRSRSHSHSRSRSHSRSSRRKRSHSRSYSRSYSRSPKRRHRHRHRSHRYRSYSRSRSQSRSHSPFSSRKRHRRRYRSHSRSHSRSPLSNRKRHDGNRFNPSPADVVGVFGLSLYTSEKDLKEIFSKYGELKHVNIVYDHLTGRSRGFGFVYFGDPEDAADAKENCNGLELDGRRIRVDFSITKRAHTPTPGVYMGRPTKSRDDDRDKDRDKGRDRDDRYDDRGRSDKRGSGNDRDYHRPSDPYYDY